MKMKSFTAFFALMMIGLLVITGCNGIFEPPVKPAADGTGTLFVSIDGNGRTILPEARLDKYALLITDGTSAVVYDGPVSGGGAGFALGAGAYDINIKGYIGIDADADGAISDAEYVLIAEGDTGATVVANQTVNASVGLAPLPGANGDKGYFEWDFSAVGFNSIAVKIYDADSPVAALVDETVANKKVELSIGQYAVEFTVETSETTYVWREILYIFNGLTSTYGPAQFKQSESQFSKSYSVPADGNGYFYLDLNDWKATGAVGTNVTAGRTLADKLEVTFDANAAKLNLGLTTAQQALLLTAKYITVTINGTATPDTTAFRFFIGNTTTTANWNTTTDGHQGAISTLLGKPQGTGFNSDGRAALPNGVAWLILQQQAAATTTVAIESVRIDYTTGDGLFFLDLSDYEYEATDQSRDYADITYTNGVIEAVFDANPEYLNIGLTQAQTTSLANAATLDITIWGSANTTENFRYYVGNLNEGSWAIAGPAQGSTDVNIANLLSVNGTTSSLAVGAAVAQLKYFILGSRSATETTVEISSIRVAFTNKNWVRPPLADTDLSIITAADEATYTYTGTWAQWGTENVTFTPAVVFPATLKLGSYGSYTLKIKAYSAGDVEVNDAIQFAFVSGDHFWNDRLGGDYRALGTPNADVEKAFIQAELEAESFYGIAVQLRVGGIVKFVIEELTLHAED